MRWLMGLTEDSLEKVLSAVSLPSQHLPGQIKNVWVEFIVEPDFLSKLLSSGVDPEADAKSKPYLVNLNSLGLIIAHDDVDVWNQSLVPWSSVLCLTVDFK